MNVLNPTPVNKSFWHSLFAADSIAVIGARDVADTWGFETDMSKKIVVMLALLTQSKMAKLHRNRKLLIFLPEFRFARKG